MYIVYVTYIIQSIDHKDANILLILLLLLCVCLLVAFVSCAKTAEPVEMPFGGLTWCRGTITRWGSRSLEGKGLFWRIVWPIEKYG